jgi:hypothetical protein
MPLLWRSIVSVAGLCLLVAVGWVYSPDPVEPEAGLAPGPLIPTEVIPAEAPLLSIRHSVPKPLSQIPRSWRRRLPQRQTGRPAVPAQSVPAPGQPVESIPRAFAEAPEIPGAGDALEPTLLELRLGRLVARTVKAFRVGDEALLPVSEFLKLAQLRGSVSSAGRVQASMEPGNIRLVMDATRDTATIGRRSVVIPAGLKVFQDGELYVAASRLGELLGVGFSVSWPDLEVVVADPSALPVALQHRRRAARTALLRRGEDLASGPIISTQRRLWDGFVLDYSWLMPGTEGLGGSSYAVAAGTRAVGGSLEVGVSSVGRADSGQVRVDASWLGVWRQGSWLKQLRLGDGVITGLGGRSLRGLSVTNAPFVRPSLLGDLHFGGRLPPGWEVEAYRGGELLAIDSSDQTGNFAVHLPVMYGENPVDFIAYGPTGETRRFSRTYLVANELLPAGTLEYGLSGGDCRSSSCQAGANLDLRYGLSQRWALRAGAERFWRADTLPDLFHPYAAVSGSPTPATLVQLQAVKDAFLRGGLNFEPSLDLRLTAEYTSFDTRTPAPLLSSPDRRSDLVLSGFFRPIRQRDFFYLEGAVQRTVATTGTSQAARFGLSLPAGDIRALPYARVERQSFTGSAAVTRRFWGINSFILPRPSWGPLFSRLWIRTGFESEDLWRPMLASVQVARQLTPDIRLDLGVSWARGASGPTYTVSLASNLQSVRSYTTMTAAQGNQASLTQLVQGSVLYNGASGGLNLGAGPSLQRAGVAGRVFMDQNGNGLHDPGERGLGQVRIQVGTGAAISDSTGAYQVWDVVPFEPVMVAVDSLSFESPLWLAPAPVVRIVPGPNQFTLYDIPVMQGGILEGKVVGPSGESGMGGLTLLVGRRGSADRRRITTFSDGAFYLLGLAPGEYDVSMDPEQLERMGYIGDSQPARVSGDSEEGGPPVVIRLRAL